MDAHVTAQSVPPQLYVILRRSLHGSGHPVHPQTGGAEMLIARSRALSLAIPHDASKRPLHQTGASFAALYRLRTFAPKYGEYETEGVAPPCSYPPISPQAELPLIIHGDPEVPLG